MRLAFLITGTTGQPFNPLVLAALAEMFEQRYRAGQFVPSLPHTSVGPMGKVAKARLREMGLGDPADESLPTPVS